MRNLNARGDRRQDSGSAVRVTLGLSVVYPLLGLAAIAAGRVLIARLPAIDRVAACIIIVFGLPCLGVMRLPFLNLEWRCHTDRIGGGFSPHILGQGFAFGLVSCTRGLGSAP